MARKKIREFQSKKLLKEHIKRLADLDLPINVVQVRAKSSTTPIRLSPSLSNYPNHQHTSPPCPSLSPLSLLLPSPSSRSERTPTGQTSSPPTTGSPKPNLSSNQTAYSANVANTTSSASTSMSLKPKNSSLSA